MTTTDRAQLAAEALRNVPVDQRDSRLADAVEAFEKITRRERPHLDAAEVAAACLCFAAGVIEHLDDDDDHPDAAFGAAPYGA